MLLPGTHVSLIDRATQCLTDFSLDFERTSPNATDGPNMTVSSVLVDGRPASFRSSSPRTRATPTVRTIRPQSPRGLAEQPGRRARQQPDAAGLLAELMSTDAEDSLNGTQCPANKLVVTPAHPIPARPDVRGPGLLHRPARRPQRRRRHHRGLVPQRPPGDDGSFVTTEPVGTEDWMPLNDHPSAKPSYDFYDTVTLGQTAIANGELVAQRNNPPAPNFPGGSTTWHWHSPEGIAAYLVENSIGSFNLSERLASSGIQYYEAQDSAIAAGAAATNKAIMDMQEDIVDFQSMFNGPFPFTTDGVVVGVPAASFEEEMQTKITFAGGRDRTRDLQPREHAPVVGGQRLRGQLQPDVLQGGHGDARRVPVQGAQRPDRRRRPRHAGGRRRVRDQPDQHVQHDLREHRQPVDRRPVEPHARPRCSPARPRTPVPGSRTSRCDRSSARTSPRRCSASSATIGRAASPSPSSRPASRRSSRSARGHAGPSSTASSPSGSTPCTRPAAAPTGRRSPVPGLTEVAFSAAAEPPAALNPARAAPLQEPHVAVELRLPVA